MVKCNHFQIHLSSGIWLLFTEAIEGLDTLNIPVDCEFLFVREEANQVTLVEVYRVGPSHPLEYHNFSTWSSGTALSTSPRGIYIRRNDLRGVVLKTGIIEVRYFSKCNIVA